MMKLPFFTFEYIKIKMSTLGDVGHNKHCSGRQCVTCACRQATDTGRQIAGSRRQVAVSGRLIKEKYKLSDHRMTEKGLFGSVCFVIYL